MDIVGANPILFPVVFDVNRLDPISLLIAQHPNLARRFGLRKLFYPLFKLFGRARSCIESICSAVCDSPPSN